MHIDFCHVTYCGSLTCYMHVDHCHLTYCGSLACYILRIIGVLRACGSLACYVHVDLWRATCMWIFGVLRAWDHLHVTYMWSYILIMLTKLIVHRSLLTNYCVWSDKDITPKKPIFWICFPTQAVQSTLLSLLFPAWVDAMLHTDVF